MTRKERLRRVAILCCHCLRNIAFYKAGWRGGSLVFAGEFWVNVNGNFIDICVLEWCKIFGDSRGKHFWRKIISNPTTFFNGLLQELEISGDDLDTYINEMRDYRDKFIAHLDSDKKMNIPRLDIAKKSVSYLYDYLLSNEDEGDYFIDAQRSASRFYKNIQKEGKAIYGD